MLLQYILTVHTMMDKGGMRGEILPKITVYIICLHSNYLVLVTFRFNTFKKI